MKLIPSALLAAALCGSPAMVGAQTANPYDGNQAAMRAGRALYATRCAECHGADAKGISGPDLTMLWALGTDDDFVFRAVRDGVSGSIMPSSSAPDTEVWAMVAYLKGVSTVSPVETDAGDAARGLELFESTCARCHRVNRVGGRLGPDLSRIARVRTRDVMTREIRDPSASVRAGYRAVSLVTEDGLTVRGAVKREDAFSIQVLDTQERLQGYVKETLQEIVSPERSLMPAYGPSQLSDSELDDLLAYLVSLVQADPDRR
jgi:putative heme-binding domain-containing protein